MKWARGGSGSRPSAVQVERPRAARAPLLSPSGDFRRTRRGRGLGDGAAGAGSGDGASHREQGVALLVAITAIAILSVMLTDLHQTTTTGYVVATTERDALRAEYMAKSGLNLTRLLVSQEPAMRRIFAPVYSQLVQGQTLPQLPVWSYANVLLQPFCDYEATREASTGETVDFRNAQGLGETPGTCEITAFAENSRININNALFLSGDDARRSLAMQLFALVGGYQSPSPYDPLFARPDGDGMLSSRQDVVTSIIDWWDYDSTGTDFDLGSNEVRELGSEDNVYARMSDPYTIKNAPFDSLEELRLVRGVTDDFWATFIEPKPDDPASRVVTIYGSGLINPNEAPPEVMLARVCSFASDQTLCTDPLQQQSFIGLINTVRGIAPLPFFSTPADFVRFLEGQGFLYESLKGYLGEDNPLLFKPITIASEARAGIMRSFITRASIITVHSKGVVGRAEVELTAVLNFHRSWRPPAPLTGRAPATGIFHYYRVD